MTGNDLKQKIKDWGFIQSNVADSMGISPQALESKFGSSDPKLSFVVDLAKAVNKSVYELIDDGTNSAAVKEPASIYTLNSLLNLRTDKQKEIQRIPLYNVTATAGVMDLISDENKERYIPIDYIQIPNMPKCDGALPITGDSMYPLLKSGDIVLFKHIHDKTNIIWGEMYLAAISHNGDTFFFSKYIQKSAKEGFAKFVSENKHHQPVEFPIDSIQAIALIKGSIRYMSQF